MAQTDILEQLAVKKADVGAIADRLIADAKQIPIVIQALKDEKSSRKFAYEKVLRLVSEKRPELIYPYFEFFCSLLDHENNFLKWGAIMTVANLTASDDQNKFEILFPKYFAPIQGPTMVTAANIIGSSLTIARAKPALTDAIQREILKVEKAKFLLKGQVSPECRNVAIGHAIEAMDKLFDRVTDRAEVIRFVKRQLKNTREPVVRKAEQFLRKHRE